MYICKRYFHLLHVTFLTLLIYEDTPTNKNVTVCSQNAFLVITRLFLFGNDVFIGSYEVVGFYARYLARTTG